MWATENENINGGEKARELSREERKSEKAPTLGEAMYIGQQE